MATAVLNAEPSLLEDHEINHLPPKSYLDVTQENTNLHSGKDQPPPVQYTGHGEDDAPRSPRKKTHKKNASVRMNGHPSLNRKDTSRLVIEHFRDKDGDHLTTLKRNDTELVSGRRAGAGWERSQYDSS